ncbi:MAG: thioredoxin domain-containing protein [Chthoniobacterales bacterium]
MKQFLPFVLVGAVGLLALGSGTALYFARRPAVLTSAGENLKRGDEAIESARSQGPADAHVTLEEFGDFQCPPCAALSDPINEIAKNHAGKLRVIFRHFPLPNHVHAREAACAAEAAALQGRFWPMHDLLYREQANWSKAEDVRSLFNAYAGMLGLRLEQFSRDLESEKVKARVEADHQRGATIGVTTTPTVFVNGRAVPPSSVNPAHIRQVIEAAVNGTPAL